jgi:hypothetical protein
MEVYMEDDIKVVVGAKKETGRWEFVEWRESKMGACETWCWFPFV